MKFSPALLFAVAAADDKKVPPRHPLGRLATLTRFSEEILTKWFASLASVDNWVSKFANNAARMERNFKRGNQRCGFYDPISDPIHGGPERKRREAEEERLSGNPVKAVRQITTGYKKWAERYLSQCSGQRQYQHQVNRMTKWNNLLQGHMASQQ